MCAQAKRAVVPEVERMGQIRQHRASNPHPKFDLSQLEAPKGVLTCTAPNAVRCKCREDIQRTEEALFILLHSRALSSSSDMFAD